MQTVAKFAVALALGLAAAAAASAPATAQFAGTGVGANIRKPDFSIRDKGIGCRLNPQSRACAGGVRPSQQGGGPRPR